MREAGVGYCLAFFHGCPKLTVDDSFSLAESY